MILYLFVLYKFFDSIFWNHILIYVLSILNKNIYLLTVFHLFISLALFIKLSVYWKFLNFTNFKLGKTFYQYFLWQRNFFPFVSRGLRRWWLNFKSWGYLGYWSKMLHRRPMEQFYNLRFLTICLSDRFENISSFEYHK